jgi:hypothetical protein
MPGWLLITALLTLFGCAGPVSFTRLTDTAYPPASKDAVEVFIGQHPSREHIRIALISSKLRKEKFAANVDLMKRQAAELGADGIVVISAKKSTLGSMFFSDLEIAAQIGSFSGDTGYSYSAYAFKYVRQE